LTARDDTSFVTASSAYIDAAAVLQIIPPLAGDYMIEHGLGQIDHTANDYAMASLNINGADQSSPFQIQVWGNAGAAVISASLRQRFNAATALTSVKQRYKANGGTASARFFRRYVEITPVRVG